MYDILDKNQKIDFLYIFNFEPPAFEGAIKRLRFSIESIKNQNVNVCISNNSKECIGNYVEDLVPNVRYIHKHYSGHFSRAISINFAVRNLVQTEYFIMSDIDLIYQKKHIELLIDKVNKLEVSLPIRYVMYNYNEDPIYSNQLAYSKNKYISYIGKKLSNVNQPLYLSDFEELIKFPKSKGGFAHGNGLIHLDSFMKIRGYDEEMIGYGPEDDLFNTRISKINHIVYDDSIENATLHLWHPRFHMIQHKKNMQIWKERKKHYNSLKNPTTENVMGNTDKKEWGVI